LLRTVIIFLVLTILTGIIYPLLVTGIVQLLFPEKANGSLIVKGNKICGSELIGQQFDSLAYFSSRPSSVLYNPLPSGGSNYGLTNRKLVNLVTERKNKFIVSNYLDTLTVIPSEMLFASASGLDPHISPEAALLQVKRIVKYRGFSPEQRDKLSDLIKKLTEEPQFHLLGQARINVFLLNLSLDTIK